MSAVTDILDMEQIHDLWGSGFTIVLRQRDLYHLAPELIPRGMAYQWNDTPDRPGWQPVPNSRHDGLFAPFGTPGDIEVQGLHLCQRPAAEVEAAKSDAQAAAHKQVDDWAKRFGGQGISGGVRVGGAITEVGHGLKSIGEYADEATKILETTVQIPRDMTEHIPAIFKERDRLEATIVRKDRTLEPGLIADKFYAAIDENKRVPWWPTLRAIILPFAVENVRNKLKETQS